LIASEYGWSIKKIGQLTPKQAQLLCYEISKRRFNEDQHQYQMRASLQGVDYQTKKFPERSTKRSNRLVKENHAVNEAYEKYIETKRLEFS
jgi:hypothetical protein